MSSLAAAQADGYYIPPDYLESGAHKKKSLNQYAGSKGHNQFLQRSVCRFELPFDGFCTKCDAIVGKGTRFNAHKAHVDDYFTTKIYEFTTRCRACGDCEFKIRTNPKDKTFHYVLGIRKKVEEFDSAEAGTHGVIDTDVGSGILQYKNGKVDAPDGSGLGALHLLEKDVAGHRRAQTEHERTTSLLHLNAKMGEDADANASLRSTYRKDRKAKKRRLGEASGLGLGRGIELAGATTEDAALAKRTMETHRRSRDGGRARLSEKEKFRSVRSGGIFGTGRGVSSGSRNLPTRTPRQKTKDERNGSNGKGSAQRQKVTICPSKSGLKSMESKLVKPSTPDNGAIAALSSYGSDSD
ncbi:hypothetical protein ACHAWF_006246 [Thalassiosira exigua]